MIEDMERRLYNGYSSCSEWTGKETLNFTKVMYLNNSGGANKQGHAVIMLVTDDGKGVIYSFAGDANQTFKIIAGGSVEGKLKVLEEISHTTITMIDS